MKKTNQVNPLGMEDADWFVYNILASAGIGVELVSKLPNEDLYSWSQITSQVGRELILEPTKTQVGLSPKAKL